jgi:hypothetical protein
VGNELTVCRGSAMEVIITNKEFDENMVVAVKQAFGQIIDQLQDLNLSSLQIHNCTG